MQRFATAANGRLGLVALAGLALVSAAVLAGALIGALVPGSAARAWTTTSFSWVVHYTGDRWMNYDNSGDVWSTTVDWPVRFIFQGNANVNKVKGRLDGCAGDPSLTPQLCASCSSMSFKFNDGYGDEVDRDGGIKGGWHCSTEWDHHMRIYGRPSLDYFYNWAMGYYVIATNHRDYEPIWWFGCSAKYRSTEQDETWWVYRLLAMNGLLPASQRWTVYSMNWWQGNPEAARWVDASHYVESDGYAAEAWVP